MNRLKKGLRRWPFLYGVAREAYHSSRRVLETRLLGTRLQEWTWRRRRDYGTDGDVDVEQRSRHPHRKLLLERILTYAPIEAALEIGCSSGPNLYLLASTLPTARVFGIDLNGKVIEVGRQYFYSKKMGNVQLSLGKADQLDGFSNKSIDVVFTDAVLMYVGPDKVQGVIREAVRVARKAVVFNEWHHSADGSFYDHAHWVHNFQQLLMGYVTPHRIIVTKIADEAWEDAKWRRYGYIVEADLGSFGNP